jgi:hypothetical protein
MTYTKATLKFLRLHDELDAATAKKQWWEREQYRLRKEVAAAYKAAFKAKKKGA